ncbi:MAG: cytochrome-c peroxidase [Gammaproteobacteria bacterium]|nr:MAG: cytochrome-c peroxidase [Gammaproteobacteria bacterium]
MKEGLKNIVIFIVVFIGGLYFGGYFQEQEPQIVGDANRYQSNNTVESKSAGVIGLEKLRNQKNLPGGKTIKVTDGQKIQDAVIQAEVGDTILVYPGTYKETVYIDKDNISMIGVIVDSEWPVLNGEHNLNDAFLYSGNGFTVENFKIINYKGNGVMGQAGNNFVIRNLHVVDTGVYGIFPEFGTNGLIENNILTGIEDAAIYVGMSDNIHVANNEVYGNVAGIEIENSRHAIVEDNMVYDNSGGILVFITPGLPIKTTFDVIVRNNFVVSNNHVNFAVPGSIVAGVPSGTGILIMAGDEVTLEDNIIRDNKNAGIIITDHGNAEGIPLDPGADPYSDQFAILNNVMINNGYDAVDQVKALALTTLSTKGLDIIRIGDSKDSCVLDKEQYHSFGVSGFGKCAFTTTAATTTYLLDELVQPREISKEERGKMAYYGVCSGCHAYNVKMIGPPVVVLQAMYQDNPQGIVDYITNPIKKRDDYPEMPPQAYLSEEVRMAAAEFLLTIKN